MSFTRWHHLFTQLTKVMLTDMFRTTRHWIVLKNCINWCIRLKMSTIECSGLDWFRKQKQHCRLYHYMAPSCVINLVNEMCSKVDGTEVCQKPCKLVVTIWSQTVTSFFWQTLYISGYFALPCKFKLVDGVMKPRQKPWKCHWLQSSSSQVLQHRWQPSTKEALMLQ